MGGSTGILLHSLKQKLVTTKATLRSRERSAPNLNCNFILCESRLYQICENINIKV